MNLKKASVLILCGILVVSGFWLILDSHGDEEYRYNIKTEQVQSSEGYSDSATDFQNLSEAKRSALQKAFKKSDHFFGSANSRIATEERLHITTEERFQQVNVGDTQLLVSISGGEEYNTVDGLSGVVKFVVGFLIVIIAAVGIGFVAVEEM